MIGIIRQVQNPQFLLVNAGILKAKSLSCNPTIGTSVMCSIFVTDYCMPSIPDPEDYKLILK